MMEILWIIFVEVCFLVNEKVCFGVCELIGGVFVSELCCG